MEKLYMEAKDEVIRANEEKLFVLNEYEGGATRKEFDEAKEKIESQKFTGEITNLEEQAISMVGKDIYEKLIKGHTEKQWNRPCTSLPPAIIKRLPVRFDWGSNYFNDKYTGIPIGGYTQIFEKLLDESVKSIRGARFDDFCRRFKNDSRFLKISNGKERQVRLS